MTKHILLVHSTRRKYLEAPELPGGAKYDRRQGYWFNEGMPLVRNQEFKNHSVSKKCDQETGEDLKGE